MLSSLMLTAAMCIPVGGRKEVVSVMQEEANKISYYSQKTADLIDYCDVVSFTEEMDVETQNFFFAKTIVDREERLGILDKEIAYNIRKVCETDFFNERVSSLENAYFGEKIATSSIMHDFDDACSSFVETVQKVDEMQEEKPVEEEIQASGYDWFGDVAKNYVTGIFPIYPYNPEKVKFQINGTYLGDTFIGIRVSRDACLALVDSIDSFLNFITVGGAISGAAGKAITGLAALMPTVQAFLRGATLNVLSIVLYIYSVIAPLWAKLMKFLTTTLIGFAITLILTVLATAAVTIVVQLFVCGLRQIDYINGIVIHPGFFNIQHLPTNIFGTNNPPFFFD
jgi:hypothetical protein